MKMILITLKLALIPLSDQLTESQLQKIREIAQETVHEHFIDEDEFSYPDDSELNYI